MNQTGRGRGALVGVAILALALSCSPILATHTQQQQSEQSSDASERSSVSSQPATRPAEQREPELWLHAVMGSPAIVQQMHAKGARGIVDLRYQFNRRAAESLFAKYNRANLSLCVTLRWRQSAGTKGKAGKDLDAAPTQQEADEMLDQLMRLINSPQGKAMGDRLWIQFYNEIAGGPGSIRSQEAADGLFAFATRVAERIRAEAPRVRIVGPGITGTDVLRKTALERSTKVARDRHALLMRIIRWSAQHADAVDLHLHSRDGQTARTDLETIRQLLDQEPQGKSTGIVSMEWSCARFPDRDDPEAVRRTILDIWEAMAQYNVLVAAYSSYGPGLKQSEMHRWKNLTDVRRQPREPFYSTVRDIAGGRHRDEK